MSVWELTYATFQVKAVDEYNNRTFIDERHVSTLSCLNCLVSTQPRERTDRSEYAAAAAHKAMMDAAAYKSVAERELRKRVGFQLKNEGKALEEMKEMRRDDR